MGDDGSSLGHVGAQTAGVIEMMMRVDHVFDGLIRNQLLGFRHHRRATLIVLPTFHNHDAVFEIQCDRRVASQNQVDAVAQLFCRHRCRSSGSGRRCRCRNIRGSVGLHVGHRQIQHRVSTLLLQDVGRKLHAAKILVRGKLRFKGDVT